MARRRTLLQNIRFYKQQYLRLLAYEARLNHQLFKLKKRIQLLTEEEKTLLGEKVYLRDWLKGLQQQKAKLESQPVSRQRNTQLTRVEKQYKQVKAKHSRNQYQLDKLDIKKDKDNAVKLLLKEVKLAQVRIRIQAVYETWMRLEQIQQQELAIGQAGISEQPVDVPTHTATAKGNGLARFGDTILSETLPLLPVAGWNSLQADASSLDNTPHGCTASFAFALTEESIQKNRTRGFYLFGDVSSQRQGTTRQITKKAAPELLR